MNNQQNQNESGCGCGGCGCLIGFLGTVIALSTGNFGLVLLFWPIAYLFYLVDDVASGRLKRRDKKREWWR